MPFAALLSVLWGDLKIYLQRALEWPSEAVAAPGICSGVWGFYLFCFNGIHWVDLLIQSPGSVLSPGWSLGCWKTRKKGEKRQNLSNCKKKRNKTELLRDSCSGFDLGMVKKLLQSWPAEAGWDKQSCRFFFWEIMREDWSPSPKALWCLMVPWTKSCSD